MTALGQIGMGMGMDMEMLNYLVFAEYICYAAAAAAAEQVQALL